MKQFALVLTLGAVLGCGRAPDAPPPPGDPRGDPLPPVAPSEEPPVGPLSCASEPDLPPPVPPLGSCGASLEMGPGVEILTAHGYGSRCAELAIDGGGTIAGLGVTAYAVGYWSSDLQFVSTSDGAVLRAPFDATHVAVFAVPEGFLAFRDPDKITVYAHDGSTVTEATIEWGMRLIARRRAWGYSGYAGAWPDPAGGFLVAMVGGSADGDVELRVAAVGPTGEVPRAPFVVASRPPPPASYWHDDFDVMRTFGNVAVGRDGEGRLLAIWDGWAGCGASTIAGRWFSADGVPLGDAFVAARDVATAFPTWGVENAALVRIPDGGLALARHGAWIRRFAGGIPAGAATPEWLAARARERLVPTPDADVVAALRPATAADPRPRVELVASGGAVCGSAELPAQVDAWSSPLPGPAFPTVGVDGTIASWISSRTDPDDRSRCVFRAWPNAIR